MLSLMLAGSLAGLVHVISGPDHLTAVAPLALRRGRNGWLAGWTWGLGHTAGVVSVATLAVVLRASLPPIETLSNWGERIVGVALIAIGAWALRRGASIGNVAHQHGGHRHEHPT